jgi:hypothetical protein
VHDPQSLFTAADRRDLPLDAVREVLDETEEGLGRPSARTRFVTNTAC